jgi:FkbM family methyltransferase
MNFKSFLNLEFNAPFLRKMAGLIYKEGKTYRMFVGPMKGKKLYYTKEVNAHAVTGAWELNNFKTLLKLVKKGFKLSPQATIIDVGANIGMYEIFFSKQLGDQAKVIAFEPAREALHMLKQNIAVNKLNLTLVEKAVSNEVGTVDFFESHHHVSSLIKEWAVGYDEQKAVKVTVPCTTLDAYCSENELAPDFIKVDIEGGGMYALPGAYNTIAQHRPLIFIESHMAGEDQAIIDVLANHNYEAFRVTDHKWVTVKSENYKNPNGVHGTLLLCPAEKAEEMDAILLPAKRMAGLFQQRTAAPEMAMQ